MNEQQRKELGVLADQARRDPFFGSSAIVLLWEAFLAAEQRAEKSEAAMSEVAGAADDYVRRLPFRFIAYDLSWEDSLKVWAVLSYLQRTPITERYQELIEAAREYLEDDIPPLSERLINHRTVKRSRLMDALRALEEQT